MAVLRFSKKLVHAGLSAILVTAVAFVVRAQSVDIASPSPIKSDEVAGSIAARDIGDARLTDHFYALLGTPGDLLITVDAHNLNGDIDVFKAAGLRPLLKFALYAESSAPVTKSIYLRQREELILRVQARSPNDDQGIYLLTFGGSFEAMAGGLETTEPQTTAAETAGTRAGDKKLRRVSSVGARIDEPSPTPAEVGAASNAEATSASASESAATEERPEKPAEAIASKASRETPARSTTRRSRGRARAGRETAKQPPTDEREVNPSKPAKSETESNVEKREVSESGPETPTTSGRNSKKSGNAPDGSGNANSDIKPGKARGSKRAPASASDDSTPVQPAEARNGSTLMIEMMDGTRVERPMSSVRQVILENGQIVVTGTDGKVERIRLARVVRMSIGP